MHKKILLFITGVIPILFLIPAIYFFTKDNRKDLMETAFLLNEKTVSEIKKGQLVKFDAILSNTNPLVKDNLSIATFEKYTKGDGSKRPFWSVSENLTKTILANLSKDLEIKLVLAEKYVPCGDKTIVKLIEAKKLRLLGLENGTSVSAIGEILETSPIIIDTKMSLCTGTLSNFESYLRGRLISYIFLGLCIFIPGIAIVLLALKKSE
jgi:hypothetical protein